VLLVFLKPFLELQCDIDCQVQMISDPSLTKTYARLAVRYPGVPCRDLGDETLEGRWIVLIDLRQIAQKEVPEIVSHRSLSYLAFGKLNARRHW